MAALGFDFLTITIYTVQFGILFLILYNLAYQPISNMLEKRRQTIADGLAAAEKAKEEANQQKAKFEEQLAKEREEAQIEVQKASESAQTLREEILAAARKEAEEIKARAKAEAEQEKQQVSSDLQKQAAELAMQMTRKIVGEAIDESAQRKLTDQFLANLGES